MRAVCLFAALLLAACSRENNLLLGRVEANVGGHRIVVTDCYRTQAPQPQHLQPEEWRYTPCRDADILIKGGDLTVNGQVYGHLQPADGVLVDHGAVSVQKN